MKKVININFQGQVIAIEETAYEILKQYIEKLECYFAREEDGAEIVNDIENRIAELFGNRLKLGIECITDEDVETIVASIGRPEDFDSDFEESASPKSEKASAGQPETEKNNQTHEKTSGETAEKRHLYRNTNDKILGGVCSGIAHYLGTDPSFIRLVFILSFSLLFWIYLLLWIVLKPMPLESNITKRLYRNPGDKILGGVCGGIAVYFKIDSWIPRLIFLLPLIINLFGIFLFFPWNRVFDRVDFNFGINASMVLAYIVLWVIIPKATSVKQKLEMMGEEEYIKSIRSAVSDNVANVKSKMENEVSNENSPVEQNMAAQSSNYGETHPLSANMPPEPPKTITPKKHYAVEQPQRSGCLSAIIVFLKIIFFGLVSIFAVLIVVAFVSCLFAGVSLVHLQSLVIDKGFETTLLWLSIVLLLGIPAVASVLWLVRRIAGAKSYPVIGYVALSLWVLGVVSGLMLTFKLLDKFKAECSSTQTVMITQPTGNKLYVDMESYASSYYGIRASFGDGSDISGLPYYTENEDSLLFDNISLNIVESKDSLYHVLTMALCSGHNSKEAERFTSDFTYAIRQQDSLLLLPEFFEVPFSQGFRMQGLEVEIAVPAGKRIEISDRLDDYKKHIRIKVGSCYSADFKFPMLYKKHIQINVGNNRKNIPIRMILPGSSNWIPSKEYIMRDGKLIETAIETDSI